MMIAPFSRFFAEATRSPSVPEGLAPFRWQERAAHRLATGDVPGAIDVPTGFGKTSVILAWAYALASQALGDGPRTLPLRLCFVVDRRLVVDGAYEEALLLAKRLNDALDEESALGVVARALRDLSGGAAPLEVARLRGGVTWEARWLPRPDQPAVVAGTVDQFGSRLLFRGYGASERMRPIDAALVGLDSWLVVDEAHIAGPLAATAARVKAYQQAGGAIGVPPLRMTLMSATVRSAENVLAADLDEETDERAAPATAAVARRRAYASKRATLVDLPGLVLGGRGSWRTRSGELGLALADLARHADADARLVTVIANTIRTARAAHARLESKGEQAILLVGRCREHERERLLAKWYQHLVVGSERAYEGRLFLVATQTIEVGVNLDADLLVTECAPLPSLVQRFGRVNRVGDREGRTSLVVHAPFAHDEDPVYGSATAATWAWLQAEVGEVREGDARRIDASPAPHTVLDVSPAALRALADRAPTSVVPPEPRVPVLLGAHLERWAATNPAPWPDQDVAPFLHGVGGGVPEVAVAWRAAPPEPADGPLSGGLPERWNEWLALVRPVGSEFVAVPVWEARALLGGIPPSAPTADVESLGVEPEPVAELAKGNTVLGVVLRSSGAVSLVRGPEDIKPGDRLVLRSDIGGHDDWGWTGTRGVPVADVGDLAGNRRSAVCRLTWRVPASWAPQSEAALRQAAESLRARDSTEGWQETLAAWLALGVPEPLSSLYGKAMGWQPRKTDLSDGAAGTVLLLEGPRGHGSLEAVVDDDEASTSQTSAYPYPLRQHGDGVGAQAEEFARHLGLAPEVREAVSMAARLHDLGKADRRFQVMLHDGDPLAAAAAAEPLAKSGRDARDPAARRAARISGLPRGFRHEAVSGLLVRQLLDLHPSTRLDADLVHHLVVSHHGRARPLLAPIVDPAAPVVHARADGKLLRSEPLRWQADWDHPARFESLCSRYGWWGLALLEAIVRLADMLRSEKGK